MEQDYDGERSLGEDYFREDQTNEAPARYIDQSESYKEAQKSCSLWLPALLIWHHSLNQFAHLQLSFEGHESGELICDSGEGDEERDG